MIKYLLVVLAIAHASKCSRNSDNSKQVSPTVLRATSQRWVGGAIGAGSGTEYDFYLPMNDTIFEFDSVWVSGYRLEARKNFNPESPDTLIVSAKVFFPANHPGTPKQNLQMPVKVAPPGNNSCEAILRAFVSDGDKKYYSPICVNGIITLKPLLYE